MIVGLTRIRNEISSLQECNNLISIVIFGSSLSTETMPNDTDIMIVVKEVNTQLNRVFLLLRKYFNNIDFYIFTIDEVKNDLSFFSREFKLEYLSKAKCIYGHNIFKREFLKVNEIRYKQSLVIRSYNLMLNARKIYFGNFEKDEEKHEVLLKYINRIFKNTLLFYNFENVDKINKMNQNDILNELFQDKKIDVMIDLDAIDSFENILEIFDSISKMLIECNKELE